MGQAIQVKVTYIYRYKPDLSENEYTSRGVYSVEDAMALDKMDWAKGRVTLEELSASNTPEIAALWEIVEDGS